MNTATAEEVVGGKLGEIVDLATSLYEDMKFEAVKEWKSKGENRKAIGFLPVYVPREIIHAAGAMPVGILGGGDQIEIVRGDSYFQSYICHLPRSVIELLVSGRMDDLDGFLFPSICDCIRNMSGMFKILTSDKYIHYFDLPQNFDDSMGGEFYRHEMRTVATAVGKLTGIEVTDDALRNSIKVYNENRVAVKSLIDLRIESPWFVPAPEYYLILRAGYMIPVEEHTQMVLDYVEEVKNSNRRPMDNIRVMVRGAFCEQPPVALLRTLERAGCYLVDDDFVLGSRFVPNPVKEDGDPWHALSDAFMNHSLPTASKYDKDQTKAEELVKAVKDSRADGVLLMAPSFCDPALLDEPMLQVALDNAGIPYTSFKYSEDTGQFQVIREQAGTFADAIKLWGTA